MLVILPLMKMELLSASLMLTIWKLTSDRDLTNPFVKSVVFSRSPHEVYELAIFNYLYYENIRTYANDC